MGKSWRGVAAVSGLIGWAGSAGAQEPAMRAVPPAERLSYGDIFADATPINQGLMILLAAAALGALALWAVGRFRSVGPEPSRAVAGLRYLKGMWLGSLLIGLLGASYTLVSMCVGLSNVRPAPSIHILAPGFAEITFQVMLGLLAAAVAVVCHNDLDSRLRRLADRA